MSFKTELFTHEIENIFTRFSSLIGDHNWTRRVKLIKEEIKGNSFLSDYLMKENSVAITLNKFTSYIKSLGHIPSFELSNRQYYPAISFAAQIISLVDAYPKKEGEILIKRVRGAFKNPDDMRALQLELLAATHFTRRKFNVTWPEMVGIDRFDILINDIGANGLEIECKSIGPNKGKKIHRRETLEFYSLFKKELKKKTRDMNYGLSIVLTVNNKLPSSYQERINMISNIKSNITNSSQQTPYTDYIIETKVFDFKLLDKDLENKTFNLDDVEDITNTINKGALVIVNQHDNGGVVFVLQSKKDDNLSSYIKKTIAESSKKQLTNSRAAVFVVGLSEISDSELKELANYDLSDTNHSNPTALKIIGNDILNSDNRGHIVAISFLDSGVFRENDTSSVSRGSTSYTFSNNDSPLWHDDFDSLFIETK